MSKPWGLFVFALLFLFCRNVQAQSNNTEVTFSLFAYGLTGCDATSACDTVVIIRKSDVSSPEWTDFAETEEISDDNYPVWPEKFTLTYVHSEQLKLQFELIDRDVLFDERLGIVETSLEQFLLATGESNPTFTMPLPNDKGDFSLRREF